MAAEAARASTVAGARPLTRGAQIETGSRVEFKDITRLIEKMIQDSGVQNRFCLVVVPHTTAAILINENDDPNLQTDLDDFLEKLAPRGRDYHHNDGNCDAHLKASVIGPSKTLLVENGRPVLGRWQGVFLCEFYGPRRRELRVKLVSD